MGVTCGRALKNNGVTDTTRGKEAASPGDPCRVCCGGSDGLTPMLRAARDGHHRCLQSLIQIENSIHFFDTKTYFAVQHGEALVYSAKFGNNKCLLTLIKAGADVNYSEKCGETALLFASRWGNDDCVNTLVKAGADVNASTTYGETPLIGAAENGHHLCVIVLLKAGADVNKRVGTSPTALLSALGEGHYICVDLLIAAGADVKEEPREGFTPLITAATPSAGSVRCVKSPTARRSSCEQNDQARAERAAVLPVHRPRRGVEPGCEARRSDAVVFSW